MGGYDFGGGWDLTFNTAANGQDRFTSKIHAVVDALGNPLKFILTGGNPNDVTQAIELLKGWETTRVIADKGYDAQSVLNHVATLGAEAVIPPRSNRKEQRDFDKEFYSANSPSAAVLKVEGVKRTVSIGHPEDPPRRIK